MKNNFAVCILSYNREKYLDKTLKSFDRINFPKKNIYIFDDKSDFVLDRKRVLNKYKKYNFNINKKKIGLSKNISNIINLKNFDYILLFEDHDLIHKNYFKEIEKILQKEKDISFIVTERLYINDHDHLIKKSIPLYNNLVDGNKYIQNELSKINYSHPLCATIKCSALTKKIIQNTSRFWVYGDIYLWLSLAKNQKVYFCQKNLYYSRIRENDHFLDKIEKNMKTIKEVSKIHNFYIKENPEFDTLNIKFNFEFKKKIKVFYDLVGYRIKNKKKIILKYDSLTNLISLILNLIPLFILTQIKKIINP